MLGALKKNKKVRPEPQSWYQDRYQHVLLQRKLLALVTLISLGSTLVMALVLTQLVPLMSIEPFVIQIDSKTGRTETLDPLSASELTANRVVNNYFMVEYLRAREGYNPTSVLYNYNIVRLMSSGAVYKAFAGWADPNNPGSNIAHLGTAGTREVKIKSITYLNPTTVQIRLLVTETSAKAPVPVEYNRIVLMTFEYVKMPLTAEERYINPLGFHIIDYQINDDAQTQ